jgi:predicted kinase
MLCHFLIGIPASGKSTFAQKLAKLGNYQIISTDSIRKVLYGDEIIQGNWLEIETEIIKQITTNIKCNIPVIYDATNSKRAWRIDLLNKINSSFPSPVEISLILKPSPTDVEQKVIKVNWIAWFINTKLEICLYDNQQRSRNVPPEIIEQMAQDLSQFSPITAEGFIKVIEVKERKFSKVEYQKLINNFKRSLINSKNRYGDVKFHPYSKLIDFERLLHLLALLLQFPGLGNLENDQPEIVNHIFGEIPNFKDSLEEITAFMVKLKGKIYGDKQALEQDIIWLAKNGLISENSLQLPLGDITLESLDIKEDFIYHSYTDRDAFFRLMTMIKFILHYPFLQSENEQALHTLVNSLRQETNYHFSSDLVRKDIEKVLKPYQILPNFAMRSGYFAGTGILSQAQLKQVFAEIQGLSKNTSNPLSLSIYEVLKKRLGWSKIQSKFNYPIKTVANRLMIDIDLLSDSVLLNKLEQVETGILNGNLVTLSRIIGTGRFANDQEGNFDAYLLQIIFYNYAWYVGLELAEGENKGLLRFERLDRLRLVNFSQTTRNLTQQSNSLKNLEILLKASAGLFLGDNVTEQKAYLTLKGKARETIEITVELWFNENLFRFISEGTKRFPEQKMKMSKPAHYHARFSDSNKLFCLDESNDKKFPYCFQVILPKWTLKDVDLKRWILGFGGGIKVIQPLELQDLIKDTAQDIVDVYLT